MFRLFKDNIEVSEMYLHSNNFEIISSNIIDEIYRPLHTVEWKKKKGSDFAFNYVEKLYFKCHETSLNRGSSYIECPEWAKTYHLITRNKHYVLIKVNGTFDINKNSPSFHFCINLPSVSFCYLLIKTVFF